ncbi:hypothetical protein PpBr36_00954 [Pyricularia pennisetigena]|uniref:hypothetical protein n=1 Tax=Pyricularia pennisetigena TaxID=1578925 RepID=UPI00115428D8|nr:hypothetical protein PpBr36_00954 [Pyricularia pennisetigena]TLS28246.1 hypothetical protein PpBr36_00954 [Pyricularia pennisetigena]
MSLCSISSSRVTRREGIRRMIIRRMLPSNIIRPRRRRLLINSLEEAHDLKDGLCNVDGPFPQLGVGPDALQHGVPHDGGHEADDVVLEGPPLLVRVVDEVPGRSGVEGVPGQLGGAALFDLVQVPFARNSSHEPSTGALSSHEWNCSTVSNGSSSTTSRSCCFAMRDDMFCVGVGRGL